MTPAHSTGSPASAPAIPDPEQSLERGRPAIPTWLLSALVIALFTATGIFARYAVRGDFNPVHILFSVFFSTNLLICYWEIALFFRRDYIRARGDYWQRWRRETGRTPAVAFLTARIPLHRILSLTVWADVWATYSIVDPGYRDRESWAFNVDIGNGFVSIAPTLVLYAAYTVDLLPATIVGIVGTMIFWQWTYATSMYWVSFFVAKRQREMTRRDLFLYILMPNTVWVAIPSYGLHVSVRLILDGNYRALLGL